MLQIPISAVVNQTFSIVLDSIQYDLAIYLAKNVMAMDITRNNIPVLLGERLLPNSLIIPYRYLENGNFFMTSEDGQYPIYTEFGVTQFMYFLSQSELTALRATR
jgi:hypothetical protein